MAAVEENGAIRVYDVMDCLDPAALPNKTPQECRGRHTETLRGRIERPEQSHMRALLPHSHPGMK
jgi:hypothetical protein